MYILEIIMIVVVVSITILLLVVQWLVMDKQKKEMDNLRKWLNWYESRLEEYKIREEAPIPMVKDINYLILKEEVEKYKPPYKVGQKVIYHDEGFAKVGYIHSIRTMHYGIIHVGNDKKEVGVKHAYKIGDNFYTYIIDVVKEDKA